MKFWKFYKERLKDDDLKYISYADYGRDFNDHYRALKELVESENVNLLKNWFPLEVIELTRWNPPTEQTVDSISFCAGLLLLGASNKHVSEYISSINENLIIIIDCNELFDEDFQEILLELINILIKSDRKYHEEETPFLYLAKAIVEIYYQLPHHESMGEYCLSVEHHFEHGLCAVNNPKTIYDLTYFNQRNELWKKHIKKANLSNYHISL